MDKGTHGYIKYRKNKQLRDTIIIALVIIIIFVVGYLLNDNSKNNVFTILAILLVLPGAKLLVGYIVVAPYRTMDDKKYEQVCKVLSPSVTMLSDLVITSPDKVMNLDCAIIDDHLVTALLGKEGQDISYIQTYLTRTIKNQGYNYEVKVLTDFSKYLSVAKTLGTSKEKMKVYNEIDRNETVKKENNQNESNQNNENLSSDIQNQIASLIKTLTV
ncbi:hypothetical protein [Anaerosporobacter sp.]